MWSTVIQKILPKASFIPKSTASQVNLPNLPF